MSQWSWCMLLSGQNLTSTSYLVITDFNPIHHDKFKRTSSNHWDLNDKRGTMWQISESILHCMAFRCFPNVTYGGVLILPLPLFTPTPLMPPSSPNTKPSPLQGRCRYLPNAARSERSSVSGPRPMPGRRHMTWETQWQHTAHTYRKVAHVCTPAFVFQIGQHHHPFLAS